MEIIILGSGTSHGVPMIGCDCAVCASTDPRDRRSRASIHVVLGHRRIQVDATPEFRLQVLRERIPAIDDFVLTHGHADHILGMDDMRRYCDQRVDGTLPVYCSAEGESRIRGIYPYTLQPPAAVPDGYARFDLRRMPQCLDLPEGRIESTPLPHGKIDTLGLVFAEKASGRRLAYYTDCKTVPPAARELARGVDVLILDGLRPTPHNTHLSIPEALVIAAEIGASQTYLTHLNHIVPHADEDRWLPPNVRFAWDGLRIVL